MSGKVVDISRRRKVRTNTTQHSSRHTGGSGSQRGNGGRHSSSGTARVRVRAVNRSQTQDYSLIFIIIFLLAFGLVMLYSTSSYEAGINYGDSAYYLKKQLLSTSIGVVVMIAVAIMPYDYWKGFAWPCYWISLFAVFIVKYVGTEVNGAKRWLRFGPFSVQPAELSKLAVIVVTALTISRMSKSQLRTKKGVWNMLWPCTLQAIFIYVFNRNMSTAAIVMLIGFGIFFISWKEFWPFFALGGTGLAGAIAYVAYVSSKSMNAEGMNFRSNRIIAWLDPSKYSDGVGFQTLQGLYGIGSGGIFGKGLGESMQKLGYIPEAQNDMIFTIICEELGMFGALSIITLFVILCWRFMLVALNATERFSGMAASGVMIHIALQVILNIAVVTNSIPNTGVTLPFISYGGSSVIILLMEVGMVISIQMNHHRSTS